MPDQTQNTTSKKKRWRLQIFDDSPKLIYKKEYYWFPELHSEILELPNDLAHKDIDTIHINRINPE